MLFYLSKIVVVDCNTFEYEKTFNL